MAELRTKKCPRCNTYRFEKQFIAKDRLLKTCEICRDNGKKYNEKQKQNDIKRKEIVYFTQLLEATEQIKIQ
tara:strand:- start:146 stop:361 length:216 start_codon:yes stop_codon:yes gene_type:complete